MKRLVFSKEKDQNGKEKIVMTDKYKKRLDLLPRIICIVIALIIWIYCVNMNENNVVTTFSVKLKVVGAESMSHGLQIYDIENISEVKMTVKGTNRDINKYGASDYTAYIDVSQINSSGWTNVKIVTDIPKDSSISLVSVDNDRISVFADTQAEVYVPINIGEGQDFKSSPNYTYTYGIDGAKIIDGISCVSVKGPKSIVEQLSRAEYLLEGEFMTSKVISGFSLKFYDGKGEVVGANNLNGMTQGVINYDTTGMKKNVGVRMEKALNISVLPTDTLLNHEYICEPATLTVVGDPEVLKHIDVYTLKTDVTEVGTYNYTITAETLELQGVMLKDEQVEVIVTVREKIVVLPNE